MKDSHQDEKLPHQITPASKGRRCFIGSIATLGAGLTGSVILPGAVIAQLNPNAPAKIKSTVSGCAIRTVVASDAATVAETSAGKIRGFRRNGVYIFKGVPYGASTAGGRRYMPPVKPEPWTGIRNALQYGRTCPSQDSAHFNTDGRNLATSDEDAFVLHRGAFAAAPGEDCLRANLWTPEINSSRKRPVMVYMHGGAFSGGSGHDLLAYDGECLARNHDVVVVTHNHRLNVYGYLNLGHLAGEEYASSANVGMLDIVAVLEWVRDNIENFGGDSGNVTIFGQSGGGGKVIALMAMPAARGLFHRAIVQSGPFLRSLSPDYSGRLAELVIAELGLPKSQVRELQGVPVDRLSGAAAEAMKKMPAYKPSIRQVYGEQDWGPTVDGRILPRHPFDPDAPEISADVPLLTGSNLHEFVNGLDRPDANATGVEELNRLVREAFGEPSKMIIDAYRRDYPRATPFGDQLAVPALETMLPLVASAGSGARGPLPSSQSGVSVSRPGVVVTALKQKSKGKVTLLRLWELAGESGKVTVQLPSGSLAHIARPVDLRGDSLGSPIALQGGSFEFFLSGFAPASFELE